MAQFKSKLNLLVCATLLALSAFVAAQFILPSDTLNASSALITSPQLVIETRDGAITFSMELADTPEAQRRGLMHRRQLAADHSMMFLYPKADERYMWMKNTYISLDMLFVNEAQRIISIHHRANPLDETIISSNGPAIAVVEILGGEANRRGISVGDQVSWSLDKSD